MISSQSKFYKFDGLYQYIHQHSQHLLLQTYSQHVLNHCGFFPSLWQVPAQSLKIEVNRIARALPIRFESVNLLASMILYVAEESALYPSIYFFIFFFVEY